MDNGLRYDTDALNRFCSEWEVAEMWVFGSAVRSDFAPDSDVDVSVTVRSLLSGYHGGRSGS